jgi:hypothetical protein
MRAEAHAMSSSKLVPSTEGVKLAAQYRRLSAGSRSATHLFFLRMAAIRLALDAFGLGSWGF